MSRVKLLKTEIETNDLPQICMICGEKPAETQIPSTIRKAGFPLSLLGIVGYMITPHRVKMNVFCCSGCKSGFSSEVNMTWIWQLARTAVLVGLIYPFAVNSPDLLKALTIPAIVLVSTILLETVYFWSAGRKNAIRLVETDKGTVSLEMPNGHWGVAYTTYKREKGSTRTTRPPSMQSSIAPPAAPPAQSPTIGPPAQSPTISPPPQAPTIGPPPQVPTIGPPPQVPAAGPPPAMTSSGRMNLEGSDLAEIPDDLSDFLRAIKMGDDDLLEASLKKGADVKETLPNGMNGLHVAAIAGVMQMADYMLRQGFDPNCEMQNGLTPMHLAVQSNNQSVVGLLLAKKGNPNHKNAQGRTPMHWCAAVDDERLDSQNRYKMAQVLRRGGGDVNVADNNGQTPADLARSTGDQMVIDGFS